MFDIYPQGTMLAMLVMAGFPVLALIFDATLQRHRAVMATMLFGFLFLPSVNIDVADTIYWNRRTAPVLVCMIGVMFRDGALLRSFRPRLFDLPIILWCIAPFFSAVSNGYGAKEGVSLVFYQTLRWGGPYFLGRLHFQTREQLLDLAKVLFWGGLIYLPLCIFEIRFSPVLHHHLYGFNQHSFAQTIRGSTYRPMVFLQHGLMVAMWMAMTAYLGWILHSGKFLGRFLGVPLRFMPWVMAITMVAMQSLGALLLAILGVGATILCRWSGGRFALLALAFIPLVWGFTRTAGILPTSVIASAAETVSSDRARSLKFRLDAEDKVSDHAMRKPLFGWSTRGFNKLEDADSPNRGATVDGLWLIGFSTYGMLGLLAILAVHFCPVLYILGRAPPRYWREEPYVLLAGGMAVVIALVSIDNLLNSMVNPMFVLMIAAVQSVLQHHGWEGASEDEEAVAAPPEHPQPESTRFRRLLGEPPKP